MNLNTKGGKYAGFFVVYRNWFFTLLAYLRIFPREVVVVAVNKNGNGVRLKVPVGKGISSGYERIMLDGTGARLLKVVRIFI